MESPSIDTSMCVEVMSGHGDNVWSPDGTLIDNVTGNIWVTGWKER